MEIQGKIALQASGAARMEGDEMSRLQIAKMVVIFLFAVVFYCGLRGLRSGEIRSRGYKFHREKNPLGYWSTMLITLLGPVVIIYLLLTR